MKIGSSEKSSLYPAVADGGAGTPVRAPVNRSGAEAPRASTSTTLSTISAQLQALELAGVDGDFDAGRVEAIKSAIAQGKFRVDSERVADRLIADVRESFGYSA